MLLDIIKKGTTDYSVTIRIVDSSDGTPETGVVYNTAGIDLWYRRPGGAHSSITEATQTEGGAHSDGGFVHISDGYYRLDLPDAAVASGVDYVDVGGTVTGMVVIGGRVRLTDIDLDDGVRAGMTALPNAAADAAGGLPISDAGGLDLDAMNTNINDIETDTNELQTDWANGGRLDLILDARASQASVDTVDSNVDAILVDTGTTLPATLTTIAGYIDTEVAAIKAVTDNLPDSGALSSLATAAALATVDSNVDAILVDTGTTLETHLTDIKGATFSGATDSLEAIRDRGDAAWTTGGGGSITNDQLGIVDEGTAQAATSTTLQLRAAATFADDELIGCVIVITGGSAGVGQVRAITDYVSSTDTATVDAWTTTPTGTITYKVFAAPPASATPPDVNVTQVAGQTASAAATVDFDDLAAIVADTNELQTDWANGGRLDLILDARASQASVDTVDSNVDAILVDTGTTLPATLTTIAGYIDTEVAAIKAVTDNLPDSGALSSLATAAALATVDSNVDAILVDTGTTLETHLTDIKGATFSGATDSLEAIRDRGDSAWTTGAGGTPPQLLQNTTIATLASQTSFTLTAGSADDDAYNGAVVVVTDQSTSTQKAVGSVSDYTGSTKTITLSSDPGVFTMAVGDTVDIIANASTAPSAAAVRAEIDSNSTQLAAIVADTNELQTDWANGGRLDLILDARASQASVDTVDSNVDAILTDTGTTLPATLTTIAGYIDTEVAAIKAVTDNLPDSGALSSLATAAALATVDTVVDAIKAKTDSLTFTIAGHVDANTEYINGAQVVGDGNATPWDGA